MRIQIRMNDLFKSTWWNQVVIDSETLTCPKRMKHIKKILSDKAWSVISDSRPGLSSFLLDLYICLSAVNNPAETLTNRFVIRVRNVNAVM